MYCRLTLLQLDLQNLSLRAFNPVEIDTSLVQPLQTETPGIPPIALSGAVSEVHTIVSSAVIAVQSNVGSAILRSCTVGTKPFCVGRVVCDSLPVNVSGLLRTIPDSNFDQVNHVEALDQDLKGLTSY